MRSIAEVRLPSDWWLRDIVPAIVVGDLYRNGMPDIDGRLSRRWVRPGRFEVALSMWPEDAQVLCSSYVVVGGAAVREESFVVIVSSTQLTFGERRWLHCDECNRRGDTLYLAQSLRLVCRRCSGINYASQSRPKHVRRLHRAYEIRRSWGGEPKLRAPIPVKPPHVQWKTYDRLRGELVECEEDYLDELARRREAVSLRETVEVPGAPEVDVLELLAEALADDFSDGESADSQSLS